MAGLLASSESRSDNSAQALSTGGTSSAVLVRRARYLSMRCCMVFRVGMRHCVALPIGVGAGVGEVGECASATFLGRAWRVLGMGVGSWGWDSVG